MTTRSVRPMGLGFALFCLFVCAPVYAITGTGSGVANERLVTSGCGRVINSFYFTFALRAGQKWRLVDDNGAAFQGSFTSDSNGRNLTLRFDSSSQKRLIGKLRQSVSYLCGLSVRVKSYSEPIIKIRMDARFNAFTASLIMRATGSTSNGSGSAQYSVAVNRGIFRKR